MNQSRCYQSVTVNENEADDDAKRWMQTGAYDKATAGRAKFTSKQGG